MLKQHVLTYLGENVKDPNRTTSSTRWLIWSFGLILCTFGLLLLAARSGLSSVAGSNRITQLLVLVCLAISSSLALFGALRSFARYQGKAWGGSIELSGPVVLFVLVLLGGVNFLEQPQRVRFRVLVTDSSTPPTPVPRCEVQISGSFDSNWRTDSSGLTPLLQLPSESAQSFALIIRAPGFQFVKQHIQLISEDSIITVELQPLVPLTLVTGIVMDSSREAVVGAVVRCAGGLVVDTTNDLGMFSAEVPVATEQSIEMEVFVNGRSCLKTTKYIMANQSLDLIIPEDQ